MKVLSPDEIRDVNTRYHDVAAETYDSKWGIDFGELGRSQTIRKFEKAIGRPAGHYGRSLEIGCGTGYFTLNLLQLGVIDQATATDISPGMLAQLQVNADRLGLDVETVAVDAERLPFADGTFDLVLGHAVLHHLPDLDRAFGEFARVLRPGGTLVFMGEPSRYGDRLARDPQARQPRRSLRSGAGRSARLRPDRPTPRVRLRRPSMRSRARLTSTRSHPATSSPTPSGPDSRPSASAARSSSPTGSAGSTACSRQAPSRMTFRGPGASTPTAATCSSRRSIVALLEPRLPARIFYNLMLTARRPA